VQIVSKNQAWHTSQIRLVGYSIPILKGNQFMKSYTHNDIVHAFTNALADFSISPRESIVFDTFTRFHVEGDSKGSKNGFYILHSNGLPAGHFGCNKRGIAENWCIKNTNELTDIERAAFHEQMATAKATREKSDAEKHHAARIDAEKRIESAKPYDANNPHTYLINKNVQGYGVLIEGENLLIPARDVNGKVWTLQTITPNGEKRFLSGGKKQGNFHLMGELSDKP
jgi:putative DNA primase/helicase